MSFRYLIVWDLDGTLGEFSALENRILSNEPIRITTRPGLQQSLKSLTEAGFGHTVLTMATKTYADLALSGSQLIDHFQRVEGIGQRNKGDVEGIAKAFDIPMSEAPDRMIFVGDRMIFDEPRHRDVLFHLEPAALAQPADRLEKLLLHLRETGSGSLRQGFRKLSLGEPRWYHRWFKQKVTVDKPIRRQIDELGSIVLIERSDACPVVGFEHPVTTPVTTQEHSIVPALVQSGLSTKTNER